MPKLLVDGIPSFPKLQSLRDVSDRNRTALLCLSHDCSQTHVGGVSLDEGWSVCIEDERANTVSDSVLDLVKRRLTGSSPTESDVFTSEPTERLSCCQVFDEP
ncbi:hypothetical protein PoB_004604600 [Plakobranchus ocellatus]|uniref:Uncharacterized protein n=1 Tax=Plakobranchus ocellatus TaxID=259542 RepID=A0AAV4B818_9GAST|nr:hypothetical protein PoB_004604600 [Plakobranchus ocellatus]